MFNWKKAWAKKLGLDPKRTETFVLRSAINSLPGGPRLLIARDAVDEGYYFDSGQSGTVGRWLDEIRTDMEEQIKQGIWEKR